jgi:hypothetical protein
MSNRSPEKSEGDSQLHALLERKLTIYHQYLNLTKRIRNIFDGGDREKLRATVSERRNVIKKANRIDATLQKIFQKGRMDISLLSQNIRRQYDKQMQELRRVIQAIEPIDRELLVLVSSETGELKKELIKIRHFRKANKGYGKHRPVPSKFISVRN